MGKVGAMCVRAPGTWDIGSVSPLLDRPSELDPLDEEEPEDPFVPFFHFAGNGLSSSKFCSSSSYSFRMSARSSAIFKK